MFMINRKERDINIPPIGFDNPVYDRNPLNVDTYNSAFIQPTDPVYSDSFTNSISSCEYIDVCPQEEPDYTHSTHSNFNAEQESDL